MAQDFPEHLGNKSASREQSQTRLNYAEAQPLIADAFLNCFCKGTAIFNMKQEI
jgi:hypothetical protein